MSARVSILMVKNSRSFELSKIRHYRDKPYRRLFEAAKGHPPRLPTLREWHDEELGGAINPTPAEVPDAPAVAAPAPEANAARDRPKHSRRPAQRSPGPKRGAADGARRPASEPPANPAPLLVEKAPAATRSPRKALTLGAAPTAPRGENCNIRDVLTATEGVQGSGFADLVATVGDANGNEKLVSAVAVLSRLNEAFGDNEKVSDAERRLNGRRLPVAG